MVVRFCSADLGCLCLMEWKKPSKRQTRKEQKSLKKLKLMKKKRIGLKRKREIEQEVRKQWLQEQETSHGYEDNDELDVESHNDHRSACDLMSQTTVTGVDASVVTNKKKCKCGSTIHLRTSHSDCPLRKNEQVSGETSKAEQQSCKCGSTEHL